MGRGRVARVVEGAHSHTHKARQRAGRGRGACYVPPITETPAIFVYITSVKNTQCSEPSINHFSLHTMQTVLDEGKDRIDWGKKY